MASSLFVHNINDIRGENDKKEIQINEIVTSRFFSTTIFCQDATTKNSDLCFHDMQIIEEKLLSQIAGAIPFATKLVAKKHT